VLPEGTSSPSKFFLKITGGARARAQGYPGASHGCLSEFRPKFVVSVGKLQLPVRLSFKPMTPLDQTVIKELNPL